MEKLQVLIKDSGLKSCEVARRLGVSNGQLSKVMHGNARASKVLALRISRLFNFKISVLDFWYTPAEIRAIKKGLL